MQLNTICRVTLVSSLVSLVSAWAAQAQDQGGTSTVFTFSETADTVSNPGLVVGGSATASSLTTALGFRLSSGTSAESLELNGGVGLVLTDQGGTVDTQLTTPNIGLSWGRTAQNSAMSVNLGYSRDRIETMQSLDSFINDDGELEVPTNPDALVGIGTKQDISAGARLELGKAGPFGVTFSADYAKTDYFDTSTSTGLLDSESYSFGVSGRYTVTPLIALSLGVARNHSWTEGDTGDPDSVDVTLGADYRVSPVLSLGLSVSHSLTDQSNSAGLSGIYTLQAGQLSVSVTNDAQTLVWSQKTPTGEVTARAEHGPADGGTGTVSLLGLGYSQAINDISGMGVGLFRTQESGTGSDVAATEMVLSYNHGLTQDWGLNLGVNYRLRDEATVGSSDSAGLFVTVSRDFSFGR